MTPYASGNGWTLYHGDCLKILPTLTGVDAVVTDPPYGMNYIGHSGGGRTIHNGKKFNRRTGHIKAKIAGDDVEFDPSPWTAYPCAMFGPQWYYHRLPAGGSLHSWDKRGDYKRCSFADADFVWLNKRVQSQTFRLVWRGICRHAENRDRIVHPTQKPVDVMEWVLGLLKLPKDSVVLDPFMGSATTGVACIKTGRKFVGIELDAGYCEIAARRMREAESHLFAEVKP